MVIVIILIVFTSVASFYILGSESKVNVAEITVYTSLLNGSVDIINIEGHLLEDVPKIGIPKGDIIPGPEYVSVALHQDMI